MLAQLVDSGAPNGDVEALSADINVVNVQESAQSIDESGSPSSSPMGAKGQHMLAS